MKSLLKKGSFFALFAMSTTAFAGGFQLSEENVSGLGNAYAGTGALAEDASIGFWNPAGLTQIDHYQIAASGAVVNLNNNVRIPNANSTYLLAPPPPPAPPVVPTTGNNREEAGGWFLLPSFHLATPKFGQWAFGFGVTAPFGLTTSYTKSSRSRYFATYSHVTALNIGPTVAYQVNRYVSLGLGFDAQYFTTNLHQMVPLTPTADAEFQNEGDDWGYGWNAGAFFCFGTGTHVGISYRSRIKHEIDGDAYIKSPTGLPVNLKGPVSTEVTLPDYANFSVVQDINDCWSLLGSVYWTHWSLVDTVKLKYKKGLGANFPNGLKLDLDFKNSMKYALAANYRPNHCWKLRMGLAYDQTPVRNASTRSFRLPDNDRVWLSFGAQYIVNNQFTVDAAYTHIFVHETKINANLTPASGGSITADANATVDGSVNQFGLQLTWNMV